MVAIEWLTALPARRGPLPPMTPANPQEQLAQYPPDWGLIERLADHGFALPGVLERPTAVAPDGSRAFTLAPGLPLEPDSVMAGREFAHIHNPPVGSMHLMLPQPWRNLALGKRWVLRHPFAERGWGPEGTVFMFAPRNAVELQWGMALLSVAHAWANGALKGAVVLTGTQETGGKTAFEQPRRQAPACPGDTSTVAWRRCNQSTVHQAGTPQAETVPRP